MTILTTRTKIIETKKIISSELTKIQKAFFDESMLQFYKDDNEEHLYWERFDLYNNEVIEYESHNKTIGLNYSDINTFTNKLTIKLTELFKSIGVTEFYIISHLKLDFLGNRDNKYKPLVRSYKKLEKIVGLSTYKEAFKFGLDNLSDFIEILFWITRCDMSVSEYIFIFDQNEKIQVHLCKYGNIHLTEYGEEILTNKLLTSLGWTIIDGQEFDVFAVDGKAKGRHLTI